MTFLFPLGFLALLAIPVLIIIYIIKSKYTEQVIPSTYLWELSERFLKRKNPIKMITGILSLILQILAVIFIALAIAHPVFILKGQANDYCFILDSSGSMNMQADGSTRLEKGKKEIEKIISSSADGSSYTLITSGETTDVVFKNNEDKKSVIRQLNDVPYTFVSANVNGAITVAQQLFNDNPSLNMYVVTDKFFDNTENVTHINVFSEEKNYAVSAAEYVFTADGATVQGEAVSYSDDTTLTVNVYTDGATVPVADTQLQVKAGVPAQFTLDVPTSDFRSLTVSVENTDSMSLDNQIKLYNVRNDDNYRTLIVSYKPFLIKAALSSMGNMNCVAVTPDEYTPDTGRGYSLYIFDSDDEMPFSPDAIPTDGAVWFVNPSQSVEGTGFSRRGVQSVSGYGELELNTSTSTKIKNLLKGTTVSDTTAIDSYVKCGLYRTFYTLMFCGGDPVVFAGTNEYGNREVVFAFDFNRSNFPLTYNGRAVLYNLLNYTFPKLVDEETGVCGDTVSVNVLPGCSSLKVSAPSGETVYLDASEAICEYEMTEVGEYTVTATVGSVIQSANFYALLPETERLTYVKETNFVISGEPGTQKRDGKYEDLLYAFIILAVIVVADWAVYCYEQYQLR